MISARRWDARTARTVILGIRASDAVTTCRRTGVNLMAGVGRTVTEMSEFIAMVCAMFAWTMGYALGYKHGLKDGEGRE